MTRRPVAKRRPNQSMQDKQSHYDKSLFELIINEQTTLPPASDDQPMRLYNDYRIEIMLQIAKFVMACGSIKIPSGSGISGEWCLWKIPIFRLV